MPVEADALELPVMGKIAAGVPIDAIEAILKRDMSLTYKLLRFINSASYGFKVTVRSVRHALTLLGKREVKKWLTIIALSGICSDKSMELMRASILRARFCELIGSSLAETGQQDASQCTRFQWPRKEKTAGRTETSA